MKRKLQFCRQSCRSSLRYHGNDNFWQNLTAFRAENAGFNICLRNFIFGLKYEQKNDLLSYRSFFEYLPDLKFIGKKTWKIAINCSFSGWDMFQIIQKGIYQKSLLYDNRKNIIEPVW